MGSSTIKVLRAPCSSHWILEADFGLLALDDQMGRKANATQGKVDSRVLRRTAAKKRANALLERILSADFDMAERPGILSSNLFWLGL